MVYDPGLGGVLLFGGLTNHGAANDTWMWKDGTWTDLTPSLPIAPSPRYDAALTYDDALGVALLFGGYTGSIHLNDTWLFQNGAWSELSLSVSPPAREDASIAYDPTANSAVLFGGELESGAVANDTWTFASDAWTNQTASVSPPAREAGSMAYDPSLSGALLFGGVIPYVRALADTWVYSHGHWTNLTSSAGTAPPAREKGDLAYEATDDVMLLFGGIHSTNVLDSEWFFANGTWNAFTPGVSPGARFDAALAWTPNSGTGLILLFGGANSTARFNDTWGLRPALSVVVSARPSTLDVNQSSNVTAVVSGGYPPFLLGWLGFPLGCAPSGGYANCTFASAGSYVIRATATDSLGTAATSSPVAVTVHPALGVSATLDPTAGSAPLSVAFSTSISGGTAPFSTLWEFGDGSSSIASSGTHIYSVPGTYAANVTVTDATTAAANQSFSVTVLNSSEALPLSAQAIATPDSGSAPLNVTLSGSANGGAPPYSFAWSFGDGASGTGSSVTHLFAAGSFTATLTVTDSQGNSTAASADVTVGPGLSAVGHSTVTTACAEGSGIANVSYWVAISGGTSPYQVVWDLGSGITQVSGLVANHTYPATGLYSAHATVTDALDHSVVVDVNTTSSVPTGCGGGGQTSSSSGLGGYLLWILLVLAAAVIVAVVVLWRLRSRPGP